MPGGLAHLQVSILSKVEVEQVVEGRQHGGDAAEAVAREVQDSQVAQIRRQQLGQLPQVVLAQVQPLQAVQVAYLHTPVHQLNMPCSITSQWAFYSIQVQQPTKTAQVSPSAPVLQYRVAGAEDHLAAVGQQHGKDPALFLGALCTSPGAQPEVKRAADLEGDDIEVAVGELQGGEAGGGE